MLNKNSTSAKTVTLSQDEELKKMFARYDKNIKTIFLFFVFQITLIITII